MFVLNDDLSIYATRGDIVFFSVSAEENGVAHKFKAGDVVRIKIYGKKDATNVVLEKDFPVTKDDTDAVEIFLTKEDTKFGKVISKPTDYWYEVELNPRSNPQTIIGYDEDGAKVFKLFPEGKDLVEYVPNADDIPFVDAELDLMSPRPVQNQAIARAVVSMRAAFEDTNNKTDETAEALAFERSRLDNLIEHKVTSLSQSLEYWETVTEATKAKIDGTIESDGVFATIKVNWREANLVYATSNVFLLPDKCRPFEVGSIHTEDGIDYRIAYDTGRKRYYLTFVAQGVDVAPSSAGTVTMTYALGNHELLDIRLGADGKTYRTAGEAVRGQIEKLSADVQSSFVETGYASKYISDCKVFTDEYEHLMLSDIRRNYDNETSFRIYSCDETGKSFSYVATIVLPTDFQSLAKALRTLLTGRSNSRPHGQCRSKIIKYCFAER